MTVPAWRVLVLAALVSTVAAPAAAGDLKVTLKDGRVTILAESVPVRAILEEWAKVGQSRVVNGEKLTGEPVTLQLVDVPELQALDVLLRSAAGYLAAPRAADIPGASRFDRILILATSRAPAASAAAPTSSAQRPFMPQPLQAGEYDPEDAGVDAMPPTVPPFPQPGQMPFQGPSGRFPPQQMPEQAVPMTAPQPGMIQTPTTVDPSQPTPLTAPQSGLSPTPGLVPNPGYPVMPTTSSPQPPPKKPGGGGS